MHHRNVSIDSNKHFIKQSKSGYATIQIRFYLHNKLNHFIKLSFAIQWNNLFKKFSSRQNEFETTLPW